MGNQSLVVVLGPQLDISTIAMEGNAWAWFIFFFLQQTDMSPLIQISVTDTPCWYKARSALKSFFHVHKL